MSKVPSEQALEKSAKILAGVCMSVTMAAFALTYLFKEATLPLAIVGVIFGVFGAAFLLNGKDWGEYYVTKKFVDQSGLDDQHNKQHLDETPYCSMLDKSFVKDERGIVWVWIVALLTWAIMAIAYFALAGIVYMVIDQVEAMPYNYPQAYLDNMTLTRDVTGWFLIIMTIGILGWALISSVRKVDDTMPAY